jgi:hypothetical protein
VDISLDQFREKFVQITKLQNPCVDEIQDVDEVFFDDDIIFPIKQAEMLNNVLNELSNKSVNDELRLVGIR